MITTHRDIVTRVGHRRVRRCISCTATTSDIATLSTPHQGILDDDKYDSTQWDSMVPGSTFLDVLQAPENRIDWSWADIRLLGPGRAKFNLRYWHSSEGEPHDTTNGWSPLETAYNSLDRGDNW
jgi:hypothetical protein